MSTANITGVINKIAVEIESFDLVLKYFNENVNKNLTLVGERFKQVGATLSSSITAPLKNIGASAINLGMEFEAAMSKVAGVTGASGSEMEAFEEKARKLGTTTQYSAAEAAGAFSDMALAGWETGDMLSGIDAVMALASASGAELAAVSSQMKDGMTAFGLSAQDSGKYADLLAAASQDANINLASLSESMQVAAPAAGSLGYSVEDTAAALALMGKSGIEGSEAGNALASMMTGLGKPTEAAKGIMDKFGISLKNNDGTMKTFDEVMQDLRGSFSELDDSQKEAYATTLFGEDAMAGALAVINASEEDYLKLSSAINESEGAAKSMGDTMNDNLASRLENMKSAFHEVGLVIYDTLQPALEILVDFGKKVAETFSSMNPNIQTFIIVLAGIVGAIGPILVGIGALLLLFGKLSAVCFSLGITMAAAFWWVIAIIAALAAIVAVVVYWEEIKVFFMEMFAILKQFFSETWEAIKIKTFEVWAAIKEFLVLAWQSIMETVIAIWSSIFEFFVSVWTRISESVSLFVAGFAAILMEGWNFITEATAAIWNWIKELILVIWKSILAGVSQIVQSISSFLTNSWNVIASTASAVWTWIKSILITVWNSIKEVSISVWNTIKNAMVTTWNTLKSTAATVWNGLKTTIMLPVNYIKDNVGNAFQGMKTTALNAWEGLKSGMRTVINGIIKLINRFINGFNSPAKLLNMIPGVNLPFIPTIPQLATGGKLFGSGMAIVGEAGPELVQKSGSSVKVTPLSSQEKTGGISRALGGALELNLNLSNNIEGREAGRSLYKIITEFQEMEKGRMVAIGRA